MSTAAEQVMLWFSCVTPDIIRAYLQVHDNRQVARDIYYTYMRQEPADGDAAFEALITAVGAARTGLTHMEGQSVSRHWRAC